MLTSLDQGRTFVSYVPRWKVPSSEANYRYIKACRKQFLHYYWYVLDPVMGWNTRLLRPGSTVLARFSP